MQRLLIIYNPNSSQYIHVKDEILARVTEFNGYQVGKYQIIKTSFEENVTRLAKIFKDGDLVLAAGGDATAAVTANAIIKSKKDVTLSVLPYGNFNDLARTLGTMKLEDISENKVHQRPVKLYPLQIFVDGKFFRYATCYVTVGMTAEAVELFDDKKVRQNLQKGHKSSWRSYVQLAKWYFKNRHRKAFLPDFKLNGVLQETGASDYAAVNGKSMCRVMKGGEDFRDPQIFRSQVDKLVSFPRLTRLMLKSIFQRVPGSTTTGDTIAFLNPTTVELQAEGEYRVFKNAKKIEIFKDENTFIKVIMKEEK